MAKSKRTILTIKIKIPGKRMKVVTAEKKEGWSDRDIRKFIKGVQSGYPKAVITTSTTSK